MTDIMNQWGQFQTLQSQFSTQQTQAFLPVKSLIEQTLTKLKQQEQPLLKLQRALRRSVRAQLAVDARFVLASIEFRDWLSAEFKRDNMPPKAYFSHDDVGCWELGSHPEPVGFQNVKRLQFEGYNDEENYRSSVLRVSGTLGARPFSVGFETHQRFALHCDREDSVARLLECSPTALCDEFGGVKGQHPGLEYLLEHSEHPLLMQITVLALFVVPMLRARVSKPRFRYPDETL